MAEHSAGHDALREAAAEIRRQAPGDPGCPEDIAYYDGHMAAARVVDEMADARERAAKREAAIQGMVSKGYTRERAEEVLGMVAGALFAPGKRFGPRITSPDGGAHE